jgi:hypothetical protein
MGFKLRIERARGTLIPGRGGVESVRAAPWIFTPLIQNSAAEPLDIKTSTCDNSLELFIYALQTLADIRAVILTVINSLDSSGTDS